jgi:hypothetical protein
MDETYHFIVASGTWAIHKMSIFLSLGANTLYTRLPYISGGPVMLVFTVTFIAAKIKY